MTKKKIYAVLLAGLILISFVGCGNTQEPADTTQPKQTVTADVTSTENISDDITAETAEVSTSPAPSKVESTTAVTTMPTKPIQNPTSPISTKPAPTNPLPQKPENPQPPQEHRAGKGDEQAVAQKVLEYINQFRVKDGVPAATKLPGLTKYAEYRSRQLVTNPHHDTIAERAAATALKYGDYIDPALYGMTGEPYFEVNAREAICGGAGNGTIDEVALRLAMLLYKSSNHWAYVGSADYGFIAVGITYEPTSLYGWHCCVNMARTDLDQLYKYHI